MENELQEQRQPIRRQEEPQHAQARSPSPSNISTRRKQIKFYMEVAVLLMVAFMLFGSVLKSIFSGTGDIGLQSEQIAGVLKLVNNIGQGLPLVGAVTECQNGTMC